MKWSSSAKPGLRHAVAGLAGSADQTRIEGGPTTAPPRQRRPHQNMRDRCTRLRAEACLLYSAILGSPGRHGPCLLPPIGEAFDMRGNLLNRTHSVRSEERHVGKEGFSTMRPRWSPYH